ncbi:MAG: hypothetical protein QF415_12120 [Candidatus Undinarchaeales archaeon]|jgi:hypothetical protein|nr:hypothetical protein [Candidatus Undinarchaeales archaeon]MDP7493623.1 hypothetical protein [Candidatus Undinarchaeales archaeon]
MDEGVQIIYTFTNVPRSQGSKFSRRFWGWTDKSKYGRYTYIREGFIDGFPYIRLGRSMLIVRKGDSQRVIAFIEQYGGEISVRDVKLSKDDRVRLGM